VLNGERYEEKVRKVDVLLKLYVIIIEKSDNLLLELAKKTIFCIVDFDLTDII